MARECEVERKVVAGHVGILEDLLLAFRLPVFRRRAERAPAVHEKLYLFDAGVFRSLRPKGPLDRPEEREGQALEGLVAQSLRSWVAYSGHDASKLPYSAHGSARERPLHIEHRCRTIRCHGLTESGADRNAMWMTAQIDGLSMIDPKIES